MADWYKQNKGITIPTGKTFELSFLIWMRRHFRQISFPKQGCLVKMKTHCGGAHVGIFTDFLVLHNFKPTISVGSVCKWTLGSVTTHYKEVTYWEWQEC